MVKMDHSNRRKVRKSNARKSFQEVNGNNQSSTSYKVENTRRQKHSRDCCKNEEQGQERMNDVFSNCMPLHGQRLFAAVSDSAVCGYPVSLSYPYDPLPVSLGYPMFHPPPYTQKISFKEQTYSSKKHKLRNNHEKHDHSRDTFETVDEYTSLPPGNLQDIESDQQRRFSDPGLANNTDSEEDSLSNKESSTSCYEDSELANQIETLVQENKRLSKELKETQSELQDLKLEVASLAEAQSSCEPGFISELVREVHEAAKLKEDTLLARMKVFSENLPCSKSKSASCVADAQVEDELAKRLARLEEQMRTILAHNSIQEKSKEVLFDCQKENSQLKEELKSAIEAKDFAEANATKYEQLFNSVKKKLPNGLVLEDKCPVSLDTSESLSSSLGSGSLHSPQVTMSGPVTDL